MAGEGGARNGSGRHAALIGMFLALTVLAVFLPAGGHEFLGYDDDAYVTDNPHIKQGWSGESLRWAFFSHHANNWHPLTWLSHQLDYTLFGVSPRGHHLVSVALHALNTALLFFVLRFLTGALWRSALVAALFGLHPLHVESVAWVAERKDVLSALCWFLALGAYGLYVRKPGVRRYGLLCLLFALGLMAKPMVVTLPFVLLLLDWWPLGRLSPDRLKPSPAAPAPPPPRRKKKRRDEKIVRGRKPAGGDKAQPSAPRWSALWPLVWEKLPLFALSAVSAGITLFVQTESGAVKSLEVFSLGARIANALVSYVRYLGMTVWPVDLALLYPHPRGVLLGPALAAAAALGLVTFLSFRYGRRFPYLVTGWLWYLGTLVPVIGLVQVGGQALANRYTYVPLVGLFCLVAWGAADLAGRKAGGRGLAAGLAVAAVGLLALQARQELAYWKDSATLFSRALAVTKNNYAMHNNLGVILKNQGRLDEAIGHFREALWIHPAAEKTHTNLGNALLLQGEAHEARKHLLEALRLEPRSAMAHANLGDAALALQRPDEALADYRRALALEPNLAAAHYNIGSLLASRGELEEAIHHFQEAVRIRPDYAKAHNNLGSALFLCGRLDEAIGHLQEALRLNPDYAMARQNLADALAAKENKTGRKRREGKPCPGRSRKRTW